MTKRILVVEDQADLRRILRDLLIPANQWTDSCCPGAIPWSRSS